MRQHRAHPTRYEHLQEAEEASQELDKLLNAAAKEGKIKKVYKVSGILRARCGVQVMFWAHHIHAVARVLKHSHVSCPQLIDEDFDSATELNVTTAFCKLAKLAGDADEAKKAEITGTRSFQTLVGGAAAVSGFTTRMICSKRPPCLHGVKRCTCHAAQDSC